MEIRRIKKFFAIPVLFLSFFYWLSPPLAFASFPEIEWITPANYFISNHKQYCQGNLYGGNAQRVFRYTPQDNSSYKAQMFMGEIYKNPTTTFVSFENPINTTTEQEYTQNYTPVPAVFLDPGFFFFAVYPTDKGQGDACLDYLKTGINNGCIDTRKIQTLEWESVGTCEGVQPRNSRITVASASSTDIFASTGTITTDIWIIIAMAIGMPLAFYIISQIVALTPSAKVSKKDKE